MYAIAEAGERVAVVVVAQEKKNRYRALLSDHAGLDLTKLEILTSNDAPSWQDYGCIIMLGGNTASSILG